DSAFLVHELGAEARAPAVSPHRAAERVEPTLRRDARHAREHIAQFRILRLELSAGLQMLQGAAPAHTEVRAARHDAPSRGLELLEQLAIIVLAMAAGAPKSDPLTRERTGHEGGLATVHHALTLVRETGNLAQFAGVRRGRCERSPGYNGGKGRGLFAGAA